LKLSDASRLLADLPQHSRILIVRLRSLGDLVIETPAIAAIHEWRPDLRISVLAESRFAGIFEGNPAISEVIPSGEFLETARKLRRRHFSIAYNQHGGPRSALLTAASGTAARVGWKGFQFSFLYNVQVPDAREFYETPVVHAVEHRISQFYATGLPRGPIPRAQVFPQADAIESVGKMLEDNGLRNGAPYAVLQPSARLQSMRWPVDRFAAVANWLRGKFGIASVVNLGPGDAEVWSETNEKMRECVLLPKPLDVRELIALIANARIFVGNDAGPAHIAAAVGRPAVVVYSSTNPAQWHPWKTPHRVLHTDAVFNPQRGDKSLAEAEPHPISSITLEEVRDACEQLLAETR
jgi:ADP-heptose:LPS heptosyltransferase